MLGGRRSGQNQALDQTAAGVQRRISVYGPPLISFSVRWLHIVYQYSDQGRPMPTVLRCGPYRVYFYSHESSEPAHVHIDRDQASCKFWLSPVGLASNLGFRAPELRDIERLIEDHVDDLLKEWEAVHGEPG